MQQRIMAERKKHHLNLAIVFFENYYGVTIVLMILSCVGGIVLFLMVNRGWAGAGLELKSLFLGLVLLVTFFGFFPKVFKQDENFSDNMKRYMDYTKAEISVVDQLSRLSNLIFPKTPKDSSKLDSARYYHNVDSMITLNNNKINDYANYILSIDINQVKSMQEVYKMISDAQSASLDSARNRR